MHPPQAIGPCGINSPRRCLFLTTERLGAVFIFDITNPYAPVYQSLALPPQVGDHFACCLRLAMARRALAQAADCSLLQQLLVYGRCGREGLPARLFTARLPVALV